MGALHRGRRCGASEHDRGYKLLFSDPTLVEELLRGFLPGTWTDRLDFTTLERVGKSFVSDDLRERHSDLIWRLRLRGEGEGWVYLYLLLEFQSTSDHFMALRLSTYVGLLLEEIVRKEKLKPGDRLPAVLPLVLYNGERRWRAPLRLESLFVPLPAPLRRYLPRLTYHLLDERRLDLKRPELEENPTAALFRFEFNETPEEVPALSRGIDELLPDGNPELRRNVYTWMASVVERRIPGGIMPEGTTFGGPAMLGDVLLKWRDQGIREARRETRLETRRDVLLRLMTLRFGDLPEEVRRKMEQITSDKKLESLERKVLSAKSLKEMGLG